MRVLASLFVIALAMFASLPARAGAPAPRPEAPGVALLIGNAGRGAADATQALGRELTHLGFSVAVESNLEQAQMRRAIDAFAAGIRPEAPALFFFSGYGVDAKGANYLIPAGADIWTEDDVRREGIPLGAVFAAMETAGAAPKIVILDASRRNPFERRFRSFSAGLGAVDLPPLTLFLSAAEPGRVAEGDGGAGVFLAELLKELRSPGASADDIFNRTRLGVSRATGGQQVPTVKSTFERPLFLKTPLAPLATLADDPPGDADGNGFGPPPVARPGATFRDCARCPSLVIVPAGEFMMGSDEFASEQPVHSVAIARPFAIGRFEVTFAQWGACVEAGGCGGWRSDDRGARRGAAPASDLSLADASRYLEWLSKTTGKSYRLPSEAEWEYAARGGGATRFWWGEDVGVDHANCRGCGGPGVVTAVGSYPPNGFGLFDTAGNIAEWTADCWADSYAGAPRDGAAARAGACRLRVVRGGSFDAGARYVRSASRFPYDSELRYYTNGFRVVRDLP